MSLFPSTLTGRVLDDGETPPPVIELQGISAGQLSLVLTQYTPLETTTQNTADIGTNAAAIAALQGQVAALPAAPDLTPYALAADLAAAEGSILANASGLVAVNTSLTQGLASKANQSALEAFQAEVNGKSTPDSVDLKLANHPTTAAMNSSITSANNATLATVAATYALKSVVEQLSLDVAARQTAGDVSQFVATALLPMASTKELNAAVALRTTPLDVDTKIANALLQYVQQTAFDAALALRDGRIAGLQAAGYQTSGDLATALTAGLRHPGHLRCRPGPAGLPAGRARRGDPRAAECRALRHQRGPHLPAGLAAKRHRRFARGNCHPRRSDQSRQRSRLARECDLGPAGRQRKQRSTSWPVSRRPRTTRMRSS